MFKPGDRVIYQATEEYKIDGFTHLEGRKGTVQSESNFNGCYLVLFDGEDKTWQPAKENLHPIGCEILWEV